MADLCISLKKHADGGAVLNCTRSDGSATWQRHHQRNAAFFPLHDLTHFAVESELGVRRAFYGLIAEGWDIEDTGGKGARGPLPPEAIVVERLVGALDLERAGSATWTAEELNEHLSGDTANAGHSLPRPLTDDDLARIRSRLHALLGQWAMLPVGKTLELSL
jgi:hypothetical protein